MLDVLLNVCLADPGSFQETSGTIFEYLLIFGDLCDVMRVGRRSRRRRREGGGHHRCDAQPLSKTVYFDSKTGTTSDLKSDANKTNDLKLGAQKTLEMGLKTLN